jgi:hypothetical protein
MKPIKDMITVPTKKAKTAINVMKEEKTIEMPAVNLPTATIEIPKPIFSAKSKRKSVDATDNVRQITTRLVWNFLRSRSLIAKEVSLIQAYQLAVLKMQLLV